MTNNDLVEQKAKILGETAQIPWLELQSWFAKGAVIHVMDELDIVDVAHALSMDDTDRFEQWMKLSKIQAVTDETAKRWLKADQLVWAVVVRPWILVQACKEK